MPPLKFYLIYKICLIYAQILRNFPAFLRKLILKYDVNKKTFVVEERIIIAAKTSLVSSRCTSENCKYCRGAFRTQLNI